MKLLVTGAAGFIGSSFVRLAVKKGHAITVLDALTYAGNLANLREIEKSPLYRFVRGDIRDGKISEQLLAEEKPDALVNFAAESHVDRSILDASPFVTTNIGGVQTLLDSCRRIAPKIRFLQISTDEVYGSADDGKPFVETLPLKPSSPYAASKAAADLLALSYAHTFGMDVVITRCSNNYGPYQFPEKLIPLMTTNCFEGKKLPVYGDGLQVRDWIHCDDHSRGALTVAEKGRRGEIYNLGGGNPAPNIEIVRKLLQYTNHGEELIEYVKDRPGHDRAYLIDHAKITKELGWQPQVDFAEGLKETVKWYRENREWWLAIKSGDYRNYYAQQYGNR
jgi:dTDP-glucose 4,6-dehydratase